MGASTPLPSFHFHYFILFLAVLLCNNFFYIIKKKVQVCAEENQVKAELRSVSDQIVSTVNKLHSLLANFRYIISSRPLPLPLFPLFALSLLLGKRKRKRDEEKRGAVRKDQKGGRRRCGEWADKITQEKRINACAVQVEKRRLRLWISCCTL